MQHEYNTRIAPALTASKAQPYPEATYVDTKLARLQTVLGVRFAEPALLRQALVHRSYLNETEREDEDSNERLEFLGDAVLGMIVAEELYRRFAGVAEGDLTEMRAELVRGAALAPVGARLDLGSFLVLGHGEEQSGGRRRRVNLARAVEAMLGAVYLDRGLSETRSLVLRLLAPELAGLSPDRVRLDPKSRLQQLAQSEYHVTPRYVTIGDLGSAESRQFHVEVHFGNQAVGAGSGPNKRTAQQEAARIALAMLTGEEQPPIPESLSTQAPSDHGREGRSDKRRR